MSITVSARPRLHMGLVDLGLTTPRAYCGVGFSIDYHPVRWRISPSSSTLFRDCVGLDQEGTDDINRLIERLSATTTDTFDAALLAAPPQHKGFGTKTALALSLAAGVRHLLTLPLTNSDLQELSGRGGASGTGINTFFSGGAVWDGGHESRDLIALGPSRGRAGFAPPQPIGRWPFPEKWSVCLLAPPGQPISSDREKAFWAANTPISQDEVFETMSAMYHGVIPGLALERLDLVSAGCESIQNTGFKRREIIARSSSVRSLIDRFRGDRTVAIGMSSLGPLVYAIFEQEHVAGDISSACKELDIAVLSTTRGWNNGYVIEDTMT